MMTTFKIGDVIRLKSGGPKMTVTHFGDDGLGTMKVWCVWFEGTKRVDGGFPPDAVEICTP